MSVMGLEFRSVNLSHVSASNTESPRPVGTHMLKRSARNWSSGSTAQVWDIFDAFPEGLRAAVLLSAFAGLRLAEAAALRASDVDFMRGVVHPATQ
jgi:integrase